MTRQPYIIDTCVSGFKDLDGNIQGMVYIDADFGTEDLVNIDKGVRDIWDEEDEDSCAIQEENQYDLIICRSI